MKRTGSFAAIFLVTGLVGLAACSSSDDAAVDPPGNDLSDGGLDGDADVTDSGPSSDASDSGDADDAGLDGDTSDPDASDAETDAQDEDADTCQSGLSDCDGTCVDLDTSIENCGSCGNECDIACHSGECVTVTQLSLGSEHSCALLSDGTVRCWGFNVTAQLGDGTRDNSFAPKAVPGLGDVKRVEAGTYSTCALVEGGKLMCWGDDGGPDEDGDPKTWGRLVPAFVDGVEDAVQLANGNGFGCVLWEDKTISCWGFNDKGQLGDGTTESRTTLAPVPDLTDVVQLAAGPVHICALLEDKTVTCWGRNSFGEIGIDPSTAHSSDPVAVNGLSDVIQITAGVYHSCALLEDGTVTCWGANSSGQLGDGTTDSRHTPGPLVSELDSVKHVTSSGWFTCALHDDDTVSCWGGNTGGELGRGSESGHEDAGEVPGLSDVVELVAGGGHACARLTNDDVLCWGYNETGAVGDGTTDVVRSTPTPVKWR